MNTPGWLDKNEYPFESKWFETTAGKMHYVDEGAGYILLFVHGTPEWSFAFRHLIKRLSKDFRCIALDHLGFGLSDKPRDADYSVMAHSTRLKNLIETLGLANITLVASDFGGGISLGYAVSHSENITRVVLGNTWCWSLNDDPHYAKPGKLIQSAIGKFLYKQLNFPVTFIMPMAYGNKKKLTPSIRKHYREPINNSANRIATYAIAKELMNAGDWWNGVWERLGGIEQKPFLILWGMKDKFIEQKELHKWKSRLTHVKIVELPDAGHFVFEEEPEATVNAIKEFLS